MQHATIFGGFGGQGLLFAGHVLAQAAVIEGYPVSWMPSYGPEMRGGTASCTVIISDRPIGSPIVDRSDCVIALNPPSLAKFEPGLVAGGLLVCNASLIEAEPRRTDLEVVAIPCSSLARAAGDDRFIGIVGLGGLIARRPVVDRASVRQALFDVIGEHRPSVIEANLAAFESGYQAAMEPAAPAVSRPMGHGRHGRIEMLGELASESSAEVGGRSRPAPETR